MDFVKFYYKKLPKEIKPIYQHMIKYFIEDNRSLPYEIPSKIATTQHVLSAYEALFFDACSSILPPMNIIASYVRGNKIILTFREEQVWEQPSKTDCSQLCEMTKKFISSSPTLSPYDLAISTARFLYENTPYHLRSDGIGESPVDTLIYHQAYCTGIARTVRLLSDFRFLCVRGYLRKEFSLLETEDGAIGTPHIWNAFYDQGEPVFFDICSCISVANNTAISDELKKEVYRYNYSNGTFLNPTFYSLDALKKKYILREEKLWLPEK